jgi:hypothetical protein
MEGLAGVAEKQGEFARASQLFGAADALRQVLGVPTPLADRASRDGAVAALRARIGDATFCAAWDKGLTLSPDQAVARASFGSPEQSASLTSTAQSMDEDSI